MAKNNNQSERKPYPFQLLDGSVTTYGFRVLVDGVDTSQFERNPIMFYKHNDYELPIGTWSNIRKENGKLLADANFDYDDPDAEVQRIIGKVQRGIIKMGSVGLVDGEWSDDELYQIKGQTLPTLAKSRLREASIVPIGGNHNSMKLYDNGGAEIDLADEIKLSDFIKPYKKVNNMNEELLKLLNLSDKADDKAVILAIVALKDSNKTLTEANTALQAKVDKMELADKEAKKTKAAELVDAAIKDGRINADAEGKTRQSWIKLFDNDFEGASNMLAGLPGRKSVKEQIDEAGKGSQTELADLLAKSWDELDKSGKLVTLKDKYPDAYADKFKEKYGKAPNA